MHPKEYLSRKEASEYLKSRGLPAAVATLNKLACVGGGPVFQSFGRLPRYRPEDLDAWVAARLSKPKRSTSDRSHDGPNGSAPAEQGG